MRQFLFLTIQFQRDAGSREAPTLPLGKTVSLIFFCGDAMKLTDAHLSDKRINELIEFFEYQQYADVVVALLELKQRRVEDRARPDDGR